MPLLDGLRAVLQRLGLALTAFAPATYGPPMAAPKAGADADKPLSSGLDGYGGLGDWNPWSRYSNPIAAFFDFYEQNPWVRSVCDKIADEVGANGYQVVDETTVQSTHPEFAHLQDWLKAIGYASWRRRQALDLAICYNGMSYIQRNALGQVTNLLRIPPQTVKPVGDAQTGIKAWRQTVGQYSKDFALDDILHLKGSNPVSDLIGLPKLTSCAVDVEADQAMANFNRAYFGNGTQAGTILTWDQADLRNPKTGEWSDSDERKALNVWTQMAAYIERRFQNPMSAHLPLLLRGKWGVQGGGQAKADAQFLDGRRFNAREVCAVYGFPVEALGMGEKGSLGGSLSDAAGEQLTACVSAYEKLIDDQFAELFLRGHLGITGLATAARPRTSKITLAATQATLNLGRAASFTRNEIRGLVGFPRLAEGGDDVVHVTSKEVVPQPDAVLPDAPTA